MILIQLTSKDVRSRGQGSIQTEVFSEAADEGPKNLVTGPL